MDGWMDRVARVNWTGLYPFSNDNLFGISPFTLNVG